MTALAGVTLPSPAQRGYTERAGFRGGFVEMASGRLARELLMTTRRMTFEITWRGLTEAEAETVLSAYAAIVQINGTFVSPRGGTFTVGPADGDPIDVSWYRAAAGLRCDITLRLREA